MTFRDGDHDGSGIRRDQLGRTPTVELLMSIVRAGLFALLVGIGGPAVAATTATPATIDEVLAHAAPGATIRLDAGSYPPLNLRARHWSPPVTVDATVADLRSVRLDGVSGLTWRGGRFDGGDVERGGIKADRSDHLVVDSATFRHFTRNGIGFGTTTDSRIVGNVFTDSGSDGIDLAMSQRIVVDHNRCGDFHPTPGAHPDCIQLWSRPGNPPTADITITNNEAIGDMQGITMFNHVRNGVDDGGFDRIRIENNVVKVTSWHGIFVGSCRGCVVRHNRAATLAGAADPRIKAWIKASGDDALVFCDNLAEQRERDPGRDRCHDKE